MHLRYFFFFSIAIQMSFTFIAEGVQGVDHELEDAVPHQ